MRLQKIIFIIIIFLLFNFAWNLFNGDDFSLGAQEKKKVEKIKVEDLMNAFILKNGEDYISKKDLKLLIKKAQNKKNGKPVKIGIYYKSGIFPPRKLGIFIDLPKIQKKNIVTKRAIKFSPKNKFKDKVSSYLERKKLDDGLWYSIYADGGILEDKDGFKWKEGRLTEPEYFKIKLEDGITYYYQKFQGSTFEGIKSVILFLKNNKYRFKSCRIFKNKKGYTVDIPSKKDSSVGKWIKIVAIGTSFKIIDKGGYAE